MSYQYSTASTNLQNVFVVTNNGTLKKGSRPSCKARLAMAVTASRCRIYLPVTPGREQAHRDLDNYLPAAPPLDYRNTRSAYSTTGTRTSHRAKKTPRPCSPASASYTNNDGEPGAGRLSSRDPPPGWDRVARPGILLWQSSPSRVCA